MKSNLFFQFWHLITLAPFLILGIIFIFFLFIIFYSQPTIVEVADSVCGEINMEHINWKHLHYH